MNAVKEGTGNRAMRRMAAVQAAKAEGMDPVKAAEQQTPPKAPHVPTLAEQVAAAVSGKVVMQKANVAALTPLHGDVAVERKIGEHAAGVLVESWSPMKATEYSEVLRKANDSAKSVLAAAMSFFQDFLTNSREYHDKGEGNPFIPYELAKDSAKWKAVLARFEYRIWGWTQDKDGSIVFHQNGKGEPILAQPLPASYSAVKALVKAALALPADAKGTHLLSADRGWLAPASGQLIPYRRLQDKVRVLKSMDRTARITSKGRTLAKPDMRAQALEGAVARWDGGKTGKGITTPEDIGATLKPDAAVKLAKAALVALGPLHMREIIDGQKPIVRSDDDSLWSHLLDYEPETIKRVMKRWTAVQTEARKNAEKAMHEASAKQQESEVREAKAA